MTGFSIGLLTFAAVIVVSFVGVIIIERYF